MSIRLPATWLRLGSSEREKYSLSDPTASPPARSSHVHVGESPSTSRQSACAAGMSDTSRQWSSRHHTLSHRGATAHRAKRWPEDWPDGELGAKRTYVRDI